VAGWPGVLGPITIATPRECNRIGFRTRAGCIATKVKMSEKEKRQQKHNTNGKHNAAGGKKGEGK